MNLPFISDDFKQTWADWLEYRKEKKLGAYKPVGLKMAFNKLIRLSNNKEELAIKVLIQAMENEWEGLHPLREDAPEGQRKKRFFEKLSKFREDHPGLYPAGMYKEFFDYWTTVDDIEPGKFAFEKVIVFNFNERLKSWHEKMDKEKLSQFWKSEPVKIKATNLKIFRNDT